MRILRLVLACTILSGLHFSIGCEKNSGQVTEEVFKENGSQMLMALPPGTPSGRPANHHQHAEFLQPVISFMDRMIEFGTDRYGEVHSPMFVSILMLDTLNHPGAKILPPLKGQRQIDRAPFGGNLQHDIPLLAAMKHLSILNGEKKYLNAAEAYLQFFLDNCTDTPTGLWPWGEHAHWDFYAERPGHKWHEYLGSVPLDFWEQAWITNPRAVLAEADGCLNHVTDLKTFDYNRHADIWQALPDPRPANLEIADFPRAGGFYLQLWAFAYAKTGETKYLDWIERMMLQQQARLHRSSGLLLLTSEWWNSNNPALNSTHSCALSMLESVPLLANTGTGDRVERLALDYLEAVLQNTPTSGISPTFTSQYGEITLPGMAMMYAHTYRITRDRRFIEPARMVARKYAELERIPDLPYIPAQVFASIINLLLDINDLDDEVIWLEAAERFARQALDLLYGNGLFRGAVGLEYYESELWVSNLVYALLRLHCLVSDVDHHVPPLTFQR